MGPPGLPEVVAYLAPGAVDPTVIEAVDPPGDLAAVQGGVDPLGVVLGLAGLGSVAVVGLALVALARRRSWSYFLVTAALGTLLARTSLGVLSMADAVSVGSHHLPEHALDVVMIALLLGAIYVSRSGPDAGDLDRRGAGNLDRGPDVDRGAGPEERDP